MSGQKNSILINEHALNREPVPLIMTVPSLTASIIQISVQTERFSEIVRSFIEMSAPGFPTFFSVSEEVSFGR